MRRSIEPSVITPFVMSGSSLPIDSSLFREVYDIVSENYYGFDTVSDSDLVSGMIK